MVGNSVGIKSILEGGAASVHSALPLLAEPLFFWCPAISEDERGVVNTFYAIASALLMTSTCLRGFVGNVLIFQIDFQEISICTTKSTFMLSKTLSNCTQKSTTSLKIGIILFPAPHRNNCRFVHLVFILRESINGRFCQSVLLAHPVADV